MFAEARKHKNSTVWILYDLLSEICYANGKERKLKFIC